MLVNKLSDAVQIGDRDASPHGSQKLIEENKQVVEERPVAP